MIKNEQELNEIVNTQSKVIVKFSAKWCGPCKRIAPVFDVLTKEYPNIKFIKIDEIESFSIQALPTFYFYHKSNKINELNSANVTELRKLTEELAKL